MPATITPARFSIALLGDLAVARDAVVLPLPASKRTRALLGYLVATARPQARAALCDLLWDGPDDPRAALRWSLTKLRGVVDDASGRRLLADRDRVEFHACGAQIDTARVSALLAGGAEQASIAALEELAQALRGEFLDGLDLPACYRFHHWCVGERERYGQLRREVLSALVKRLQADAQRALPYGREMVAADPLAEAAHATVVRLLGAAGRYPDAEAHYEHARELLRREIALASGGALDESIRSLRRDIRAAGNAPQRAEAPLEAVADASTDVRANAHAATAVTITPGTSARGEAAAPAAPPLIGRNHERRAIAEALAAPQNLCGRVLLFVGGPGMGKTRLLDHLVASAVAAGWQTCRGRGYEAEIVRPYGMWIDALRDVDAASEAAVACGVLPSNALHHAAPLLENGGKPGESSDRAQLFEAAATLVSALAARRPLLFVLDDLQWLDEGSAALLHYVARQQGSGATASRVLLAGAVRAGEVDDNAWAKGLMQSLAREQRIEQITLGPLDSADAAALLGAGSALDPERALRESGGNPLYLLALARARDGGVASDTGHGAPSLDALFADQIESLDESTRELLCWAAAVGRDCEPDLLAAATGTSIADVLARLARLERRGLIVAADNGRLDFGHDLLRQSVYRRLSQARRRAIHQQLARTFAAASAEQAQLHGEVAHHASLAGDALLAARANLAAGEFCLRAFANGEAVAAAERGLTQAASLAQGVQRVRLTIALLNLRVMAAASPGARRLPALMEQIQQAIDAAEAFSLHTEAASGLHILSWLRQQSNDTESTRAATLQAERSSRQADAATRCQQLANTGRCLLEVEAEMPRARILIAEAEALASSLDLKVVELLWGHGLIARADGDIEAARAWVARAVALAGLREDHWREYECRMWLAVLDFERHAFDAVLEHGAAIVRIAQRMGDADAPFAQALAALARLSRSGPEEGAVAEVEVANCLESLRAADDQAHLAYALNAQAALDLAAGRLDRAGARSREALTAAQRVRRPSQIVVALAALVRVAAAGGDAAHAQELLGELGLCAGEYPSAAAAAALKRAEAQVAAIG